MLAIRLGSEPQSGRGAFMNSKRPELVGVFVMVVGIFASYSGNAQEKPAQRTEVVGHLFTPARQQFSESMAANLRLPKGFRAQIFARNLGQPRMMAVGSNGTIYVTRPKHNDVVALRDHDGDGRVDLQWIALSRLEKVHGIAIQENRLTSLGLPKSSLRSSARMANPEDRMF